MYDKYTAGQHMTTSIPTITSLNKIVNIGITKHYGNLFCHIRYKDKRLSISGVEGPLPNGNARGACGQIIMYEWEIKEYAQGWNPERVYLFRKVWNEWNLNDMQTGSPRQTAYLKSNPISDKMNHYDAALKALSVAGINPDNEYIYKGKPYNYGSAWLFVDIPQAVLQMLSSLPDSTLKPAWI